MAEAGLRAACRGVGWGIASICRPLLPEEAQRVRDSKPPEGKGGRLFSLSELLREGRSGGKKLPVPGSSQGSSPMAGLLWRVWIRPSNGQSLHGSSWVLEGHLWQECVPASGEGAWSWGAINRSRACHSVGANAINRLLSPTLASPPGHCKHFVLLKRPKQIGLLPLKKLAHHGSVHTGHTQRGSPEGGARCSATARPCWSVWVRKQGARQGLLPPVWFFLTHPLCLLLGS